MRTVQAQQIIEAVKQLCIGANLELPRDLEERIHTAQGEERHPGAREILKDLCRNIEAAREMQIPICQDTGMAVVFAEIGQQVHIEGDFEAAVHQGVSEGYTQGYLRASVVADPLRRESNTGDNTPAVIHTRLVTGDKISLMVAPKGFGSENMSAVRMMNPSAKPQDIVDFVVETVLLAGSNPCPPVVIGVGIGGDFELCAFLAKKALCRSVSEMNPDPFYAQLEHEILCAVNKTDIGPQGFGGNTTALAAMVEIYPTHIAGLPVAVNMGCHVTRHGRIEI